MPTVARRLSLLHQTRVSMREELRDGKAEVKAIREDLENLTVTVENVTGFRKAIDNAPSASRRSRSIWEKEDCGVRRRFGAGMRLMGGPSAAGLLRHRGAAEVLLDLFVLLTHDLTARVAAIQDFAGRWAIVGIKMLIVPRPTPMALLFLCLGTAVPRLSADLVECAHAAAKKKHSYFEAQYLRLKARRGPKKAVIAVAASILNTAYHMLADGTCYQDLGADYFARRDPRRVVAKLASRILGYHVVIEVAEVPA
jgi:hypothetical protein